MKVKEIAQIWYLKKTLHLFSKKTKFSQCYRKKVIKNPTYFVFSHWKEAHQNSKIATKKMKIQKQDNNNDWDGSVIIFKRKICIYSARGPSLANVTEKKLLKIFTYFIFGHWH